MCGQWLVLVLKLFSCYCPFKDLLQTGSIYVVSNVPVPVPEIINRCFKYENLYLALDQIVYFCKCPYHSGNRNLDWKMNILYKDYRK